MKKKEFFLFVCSEEQGKDRMGEMREKEIETLERATRQVMMDNRTSYGGFGWFRPRTESLETFCRSARQHLLKFGLYSRDDSL
jgi:hypothetical protein